MLEMSSHSVREVFVEILKDAHHHSFMCVCVLSVGQFGVAVKCGTCLLCFGTPDPLRSSAGGLQTAFRVGGDTADPHKRPRPPVHKQHTIPRP